MLLTIELGHLRYHMCDLHSRFEEDRIKTTLSWTKAIADRHTHTHTLTHTRTRRQTYTQVILSVQCHALHRTDRKVILLYSRTFLLEFGTWTLQTAPTAVSNLSACLGDSKSVVYARTELSAIMRGECGW